MLTSIHIGSFTFLRSKIPYFFYVFYIALRTIDIDDHFYIMSNITSSFEEASFGSLSWNIASWLVRINLCILTDLSQNIFFHLLSRT